MNLDKKELYEVSDTSILNMTEGTGVQILTESDCGTITNVNITSPGSAYMNASTNGLAGTAGTNYVDPLQKYLDEQWEDASNDFGLSMKEFKQLFDMANSNDDNGLRDLLMQAVVFFKLRRDEERKEEANQQYGPLGTGSFSGYSTQPNLRQPHVQLSINDENTV